jgi:TolA-binding protein
MAQNYVTLKRFDAARTKLQAIITAYPGTAAAAKAKQQLASLPSQ